MPTSIQNRSVELPVTEFTKPSALALAQLAKRIGFTDVRTLAVSEQEAYEMLSGINILREALSDAGISPR